MKKLRVLKYGVLLGVCLFLVGASPGCQRMVNFYNNIQWEGGISLTARLVCSPNTFQADTGEYSNCQSVSSDNLTGCELILDGDSVGTFNNINLASCSGDSTLLLTLNDSSDIVIQVTCVDQCGDSIFSAGYPVDHDIMLDTDFLLERDEGILELYIEE